MRAIAAVLLAGVVSAAAAATPVESYFVSVNADLAAWDISGSAGNPSHTQGLFDAAMAGAANDAQRQALVLHWEKVKQCLSKPLPAGNRYARAQVVQECKDAAGDRAAAVKAAAYASGP